MITEIPYTALFSGDGDLYCWRPTNRVAKECPTCGLVSRPNGDVDYESYDICDEIEDWVYIPFNIKQMTLCISDEYADGLEAYKAEKYKGQFTVWSEDREHKAELLVPFDDYYTEGATHGVFWIWVEYEEN